jgi:hypothetical protein
MLDILLMKVGIPADGVQDAGASLFTTVRAAKPTCDGARWQLAPPAELPNLHATWGDDLLPAHDIA